jgi:Uma2 family endonuclease
MPAPTLQHQFALGQLFKLFEAFVLARQLGVVVMAPVRVRFEGYNGVEPDLVYVSRERRHILQRGNFRIIDGAPDLLAEILSPSNRGYDIIKKAALYATFGVREYWLVDLEQPSILVQVLRDGLFVPLASPDGIARSEVLPGLEIDPTGLFALPTWMTED